MKSRSLRAALMLLLCVLLCIALNAAAFLIDTDTMRQNAAQGTLMIAQEGASPQLVGGFKSAQLDNYTAALILKTAAYTGPESLLQKAFGGLRTDLAPAEDQSAWDAFCTYGSGNGLSYSRYWHGYTFPLRLLLCVLNTANIEMLLLFVSLALACAVASACFARAPAALPGLAIAWFLLMPPAVGICLQYAPLTLLTLGACLAVLLLDARIERAVGMPAFFALTGLLTNYFDLLTFPLVSLGFPLALLLCLRLQRGDGLRALMACLIGCGVAWALGYGLMWGLKWVLTAAVYGPERLTGIFVQAALRVSSASNGETLSRLNVLRMNFAVILDKPAYLLLLLVTAVACAAVSIRRAVCLRRAGLRVQPDARMLTLLLLALVPVAWYLVMANHSFDHTYYTYRNGTVSVLACFAALAYLIPAPRKPAPFPRP